MDFLESLNLTELPEQQTYISSHVQEALASDEYIRLGFTVCCTCAANKVSTVCPGCKRVSYCSNTCLAADANRSNRKRQSDDDSAMGHTAVICSLLHLCQVDDDLEEYQPKPGKKLPYSKDQEESSQDRIRSEFESYPATIANILADSPFFQAHFKKNRVMNETDASHKRRDKRDKQTQTHPDSKTYIAKDKNSIVIHVVGASEEAELWGDFHDKASSTVDNVYDAYAEAFQELVQSCHLHEIRLIFIGPNCPFMNKPMEKVIPSAESPSRQKPTTPCKLVIESLSCEYTNKLWKSDRQSSSDTKTANIPSGYNIPKAHIIFFLNPGFTCPDYNWKETVHSIPKETPFVVATNTEMEALADIQYLNDMGIVSEKVENVLESLQKDDVEKIEGVVYFGVNPYAGMRVRQNGTMANDLYVRNRWLFIVAGVDDSSKSITKEVKRPKRNGETLDEEDTKRRYFI